MHPIHFYLFAQKWKTKSNQSCLTNTTRRVFVLLPCHLPANKIRPISSFRPMLSKSMTIISNEHSRIFSHGTLKLNDSLNIGFRVHLKIGVFRFSMRLSPNWSQTLTYGSIWIVKSENNNKEHYRPEWNNKWRAEFKCHKIFNTLPDFPLISFAFKFRALINDRVKIEFDGW